jgi:hypothetical protein
MPSDGISMLIRTLIQPVKSRIGTKPVQVQICRPPVWWLKCGVPTPDPIPNSAVKRSSANDTQAQASGK